MITPSERQNKNKKKSKNPTPKTNIIHNDPGVYYDPLATRFFAIVDRYRRLLELDRVDNQFKSGAAEIVHKIALANVKSMDELVELVGDDNAKQLTLALSLMMRVPKSVLLKDEWDHDGMYWRYAKKRHVTVDVKSLPMTTMFDIDGKQLTYNYGLSFPKDIDFDENNQLWKILCTNVHRLIVQRCRNVGDDSFFSKINSYAEFCGIVVGGRYSDAITNTFGKVLLNVWDIVFPIHSTKEEEND